MDATGLASLELDGSGGDLARVALADAELGGLRVEITLPAARDTA